MTTRIWKYVLATADIQTVRMPTGAKLLDAQMQGGDICLWALVNVNAPLESRNIAIFGTGNPMPDNPGTYVSTFQMYEGSLVFHVFDFTGVLI